MSDAKKHPSVHWRIGTRLTLAFGLAMVLLGIIALAGFWGLSRMVGTVTAILETDAKLMEHASRMEANTLNLQRFEKDVFLNIADRDRRGEYADQWQRMHDELTGEFERIEGLVTEPRDREAVRIMRADLTTYAGGFQSVLRGIEDGAIRTPAAANAAIGRYKDDIRRLDTLSSEFAAKNVDRMNAKGAVVIEAERRTRTTMLMICMAGVAGVFVLTIFVTRSITAPIPEVEAFAENLAESPSDLDPRGRRRSSHVLLMTILVV